MQGRGVFAGVAGAYPRALYRSMGFGDADFEKPLIGIANSWSEVDPGHFHLRTLAEWVKEGVRKPAVPAEFNTVAPCDGIAQGEGMHAVLPLRDVIAASVELMARANRFDGLVMLCSCDKIVPGMLMAAARLEPADVFVTGGPMVPGHVADPATASARSSSATSKRRWAATRPGASPRRNSTRSSATPAAGPARAPSWARPTRWPASSRRWACRCPAAPRCPPSIPAARACAGPAAAGSSTWCARGARRAMLTQASLENAVRVTLALGGSTNATLHLPAVAHEVGADITLDTFDALGRTTPLIAKFAPASRLTVVDLHAAGRHPGGAERPGAPAGHRRRRRSTGARSARSRQQRPVLRVRRAAPAGRAAWRPRAASPCCAATWRPTARWSSRAPCAGHAAAHRPGARLRVGGGGARVARAGRSSRATCW